MQIFLYDLLHLKSQIYSSFEKFCVKLFALVKRHADNS